MSENNETPKKKRCWKKCLRYMFVGWILLQVFIASYVHYRWFFSTEYEMTILDIDRRDIPAYWNDDHPYCDVLIERSDSGYCYAQWKLARERHIANYGTLVWPVARYLYVAEWLGVYNQPELGYLYDYLNALRIEKQYPRERSNTP